MSRIRKLVCLLAVIAAACGQSGSAGFDPLAGADELADAVAADKADGLFDAEEIDFGADVTGQVAGTSIALFTLEADEGDAFQIRISRESGDLEPSAYLHLADRGDVVPVTPESYEGSPASGHVSLDFLARAGGEYYIVVRAYDRASEGSYRLEVECQRGRCAGGAPVPDEPIEISARCIWSAMECAFDALPSYEGYVGASRAQSILTGCLEDASDAVGVDCTGACEAGDEQASLCGTLAADLPFWADQSAECLTVVDTCLEECSAMDFYGYGEFEHTATNRCMFNGHTSDCSEFARDHMACGGSLHSSEGADSCFDMCEATEGAFDEGPFDGCEDICYEACDGEIAACRVSCEMSAGSADPEYVDDCIRGCLPEAGSQRCVDALNF